MTLYFGCRRSDRDLLYEAELKAACADGALSGLRLALSREPGRPKVGEGWGGGWTERERSVSGRAVGVGSSVVCHSRIVSRTRATQLRKG